jgi:crotonobetainyl-CoA:carnitine CoA-transferase CaiB-like acyl-CoA transferase
MVFQHSVQGITPGPEGNHHPFIVPFGMFPAADGFVTIAAQQPAFFKVLCDRLDVRSMLEDERFATREARNQNRQLLIQELSTVTSRFTKAELNERLGGRIPFGPVLNVAEIVTNPHFAARDMIVEVEQPGGEPIQIAGVPIKMTVTPGGVRNRAPLLGEDTMACLLEAGLSADEIQQMIDCRTASVVGGNGESHD